MTKLLPMNPAPPVTRTLTIFAGPVVGERAVRFQTIFVRVVVLIELGGHVDDGGGFGADALPAVVYEVRDDDQQSGCACRGRTR